RAGAGGGARAGRARGAAADARGRVFAADPGGTRVRLFWHQLRWEQIVFWRSREAAIFVFLFPILLFALLTAVYNGHIYGRPASWALLAGMLGYGAANTAFAGLALILVARREMGILIRIRSTLLPSPIYLAPALVSNLI